MRLGVIAGTSMLLIAACAGTPRRGVRQADLDAWTGAPVSELETHPVFSTWLRSVQNAPGDRQIWTLTKCEKDQTPAICMTGFGTAMQFTPMPFIPPPEPPMHIPHHVPPPMTPPMAPPMAPFAPFTLCSGGESKICCHAQFMIRGSYVESYRAVGDCMTDCRHRPASQQCGAETSFTMAPPPPPDPRLAEIRKTPKAPDLNSTVAEVKLTCEQQRGQLSERDQVLTCRVGGEAIFVCKRSAQELVQCDTFFEGGDLAAFQTATENRFGPPEDVHVSDAGLRVFVWPSAWPNAGYALTRYPKGVQVTVKRIAH